MNRTHAVRVLAVALALGSPTLATAADWGPPESLPGVPTSLALDASGAHRVNVGVPASVQLRGAGGVWASLPSSAGTLDRVVGGSAFRGGPDTVEVTVVAASGVTERTSFASGLSADAPLPIVAVGAGGDALVSWPTAGGIVVVMRGAASGTWTAPVVVGSAGDVPFRAGDVPIAAGVGPSGTATVMWTRTIQGQQALVAASVSSPGGTWSASRDVRTGVLAVEGIDVAVGTGETLAVWRERAFDRRSTVRSATLTGTDWSLGSELGDAAGAPSLAMASNGRAIVAWTAPTGRDAPTTQVRASFRESGAGWGAVRTLSAPFDHVRDPVPAIAEDGRRSSRGGAIFVPTSLRWRRFLKR